MRRRSPVARLDGARAAKPFLAKEQHEREPPWNLGTNDKPGQARWRLGPQSPDEQEGLVAMDLPPRVDQLNQWLASLPSFRRDIRARPVWGKLPPRDQRTPGKGRILATMAMSTRGVALSVATALLPSLLGGQGPKAPRAVREEVRRYRQAHDREILREFMDLLAVPNVAADPPGLKRNADKIASMLERRGFAARVLPVEGGPPAVYGELKAAGARRTLAVYAHYDGQPVDPAQWVGKPFDPILRDKPLEEDGREVDLSGSPPKGEFRLYARSASDDKAPIAGLLAALDALKANKIPLSVNLKVFFEGEEEEGSPHLEATLKRYADLLHADVWALCDGPIHPSRRMQLFYGARGVTGVEATLYGPSHALHSGHYGNWAPNPAILLAHLLAGLRDTEGRIQIPGFYDDVRPVSPSERRALADIPDVDQALRAAFGLGRVEGGGAALAERILLPALNVRGIQSGHVEELATNSIPSEAKASIDFRLVPDQKPARVRELLESHLRREGFFIVSNTPDLATRLQHERIVRLQWGPGYPAARASMDLPVVRAFTTVVEGALDEPLVKMPTLGGSVPMYLFDTVLHTPVVGLPVVNHDNNQHAANENVRLQNLWDAIEVYAGLFSGLGSRLD